MHSQLASLSGPMVLGGLGRLRMTSLASWDLLTITSFRRTAVCMRRTLEDSFLKKEHGTWAHSINILGTHTKKKYAHFDFPYTPECQHFIMLRRLSLSLRFFFYWLQRSTTPLSSRSLWCLWRGGEEEEGVALLSELQYIIQRLLFCPPPLQRAPFFPDCAVILQKEINKRGVNLFFFRQLCYLAKRCCTYKKSSRSKWKLRII